MTPPSEERADQPQSPEELREEIEQTREQLGDTVEALAEKSDVKSQARQRISAVKDAAQEKKDKYIANAKQSTPESASGGVQQAAATVRQRPVAFTAAGAFAAGVLIGRLLGR